MKFTIFSLIYLACSVLGQRSNGCESVVVRREFRELSGTEQENLIRAVQTLHSGPPPTRYDEFANRHVINAPFAHGTPFFLTWHREYIMQFEELLKSVDPSVSLPYWDWGMDADSPASSYVLSSRGFGGNGANVVRRGNSGVRNNNSTSGCVRDGPFANWMMEYPDPHCLRRMYDEGDSVSPFYTTEAISDIINSSESYGRLNMVIETLPHSRVHVSLGGEFGDMSYMFSTNDPLFWMHHAYVDRIYWEWQQRNPNLIRDFPANMNQIMPPFSVASSDVFDTTQGGRYCYSYPRFPSTRRGNSLSMESDLSASVAARASNSRIKPLPEEWIERNNYDVDLVRVLEDEYGVGSSTEE